MSSNGSSTAGDESTPASEAIEADIAETRDHLAEAIEELAAKLDVKGQAQAKVAETKANVKETVSEKVELAQHKLAETRELAQEKVGQLKAQAQERFAETRDLAQEKVGQLRGQTDHGDAAGDRTAERADPALATLDGQPADAHRTTARTTSTAPPAASVTDQVSDRARALVERLRTSSLPVQAAVVGGPLALILVLVVRRARS